MLSIARVAALSTVCIATTAVAQPNYALSVIGGFEQNPPGGLVSMSQGLNDNGRVVGYGSLNPVGTSALSWRDGSLTNLGIPSGFDRSFANRVNIRGHIVGGAATQNFSESRALRWVGGIMTDLGTLGGNQAAALSINDTGQVVGYSSLAGNATTRAFLWHDGAMSALPAPSWAHTSIAYDISNTGYIAGLATGAGATRPILWHGSTFAELPVPHGTPAASAVAVNNLGHAVGTYQINTYTNEHGAALWVNGQRTDLGFLDAYRYAIAADINDAGHIVGTAAINGGTAFTGFLWYDGIMHDLRTLVPGVEVTSARGINNAGQIAAVAMINGLETAVLLTPVPSPGAAVLLGMAGIFALRRRRS